MFGFYPLSAIPISALAPGGITLLLADTASTSDSFTTATGFAVSLSDTVVSSEVYATLSPPGMVDSAVSYDSYVVYRPPVPNGNIPIFPSALPSGWSVHKKPISASRVSQGTTGREWKLAAAAYPRWEFVLQYGDSRWLRERTQNIVPYQPLNAFTELEQMSGLFLATLGSFGEFYYSDPDDCSRSDQSVGTGDGVTRIFDLYFSWGDGPFTPSLTFPVGGIDTINTVYFNGTPVSALLYGLDPGRTQLVFVSPPVAGVVITADFYFYYRCRWSDDTQEYSQWAKNLWAMKECRFESVKP